MIIPILVSALAFIYVVSPIDFLPELILGPFGFSDDIVAILIAIGVWMVYFSLPLIKVLSYLVFIGIFMAGLVYLIIKLYQKSYGRKKIKFKIRR